MISELKLHPDESNKEAIGRFLLRVYEWGLENGYIVIVDGIPQHVKPVVAHSVAVETPGDDHATA